MQKYLEPILTAAVLFPLLAALFTLPYMIYCYRKYGAVLVMRVAVMYAFLYYLICVYFLAILPFPREGTVVTQRTTLNLVPFNYVPEVLSSEAEFSWGDPVSWLTAIYSSGLYEPLCNVLMFLPLGVFLRYYFGCGRLKTVLIAFAGSLFLELTQLTGTYGLAPFVYRCCDVNDLIGNTFGGWLGYLVTPLFTCFLPSRERLNQVSYQRGSRVSYVRRCFAFLVDAGIHLLVATLLWLVLPVERRWAIPVSGLGAALLCQGLLPICRHGQTLGKSLVKIRLTDQRGNPRTFPWRLLLRAVLLWGMLLQPPIPAVALPVLFCLAAYNGVRNRPQMFYEAWLGLTQVSTVKPSGKFAENPTDTH